MHELNQKIAELEKEIVALKKVNSELESRILRLEQNSQNAESKSSGLQTQIGILNCWEFKKCGREPGGKNISELGICTAAESRKYDGINRGKNSGRICWALVGTLCGGKVQGVYAQKIATCLNCEFYQYVCLQEGKEMRYALLSRQ
jgi:hypothetical protein